MRLHILSSVALSTLFTASASSDVPLKCAYEAGQHDEDCQKPLRDVTAVTPGSEYVVKLPCLDCPVVKEGFKNDGPYRTYEENDLVFNVSVSRDRRTVLLADKPIFPSLSTSPFPTIYVGQFSPNFSRADLDNNIECGGKEIAQCFEFRWPLGFIELDYDYSAKQSERPEARIAWEITLDAIGGHGGVKKDPTWVFNRTDQKMMRIVVEGTRLEDDDEAYNEASSGGSTLFDTPDAEPELKYRLDIVDITLVKRSYAFPPSPRTGGFAQRIRYFFGFDDREKDGHHIYIKDDWDHNWGRYAKKGTLRNVLRKIWYDWPWELVFFIIFGTLATVLAVIAVVKLFSVVVQQRKLARWQGIDEVWARMRREPTDEEEDGLLNGEERYSDNVTPRLTNEYMRAKPLPSKPLPDKPLPEIPLIDDL